MPGRRHARPPVADASEAELRELARARLAGMLGRPRPESVDEVRWGWTPAVADAPPAAAADVESPDRSGQSAPLRGDAPVLDPVLAPVLDPVLAPVLDPVLAPVLDPVSIRGLPARWRMSAAGGLGLVLVAVLAAVAVVLLWRWQAPHQIAAPPRGLAAPSASAGGGRAVAPDGSGSGATSAGAGQRGPSATAGSSAAPLVVDVVGAVRHPGVVQLASGARVQDAVKAAGGALPGARLQQLNLARRLQDGEQVVVLAAGQPAAPAAGGGGPAGGGAGGGGSGGGGSGGGVGSAGGTGAGGDGGAPGALLDLNAATAQDFDSLPGVGPVLAQRIIDWRQQHGGFTSVAELREVSGIGDARFQDLSKRVRV